MTVITSSAIRTSGKQHRRSRLITINRKHRKFLKSKNADKLSISNRHGMSSQKNFNFHGHSLGTVTIKLNKKGISLFIANPLNYMVPEVGIEPT